MEQPTYRDFLIHLEQANFQAAIDLADELELDKDLAYKAHWTKQKQTRGLQLQVKDIELLALVQDHAWVIGECLEVCANQPQVQKNILKLGQTRVNKLTEPILATLKQDTALSPADKTWLRSRLYFLQYLDRFETFSKIWASQEQQQQQQQDFAIAYVEFRDSNLIAKAIEYARSENHVALDAIFMHHGSEVLLQRLFILSQIPETTDPSRFDLPHVTYDHEDRWLEEPWRKDQDPVEQEWVKQMISLEVQEQQDYLSKLQNVIPSIEYPTSSKVIVDWYMERAHAADRIGLSSHALEIIRYAQVMGVTGIESQVAEYEWLCKYVYGSLREDSFVNLEEFNKLSSYQVLEGLLSNTNAATIIDDMLRLALPWIEVSKDRQDHEYVLCRWLLSSKVVDQHLDWCCAVLEMSKPTVPLEDRIIKDDLGLSRLVLAIVYSGDGPMDCLVRLFECLPIFNDISERLDEPTDISTLVDSSSALDLFFKLQSVGPFGLTQMMDTLQNHLGSAEVLARYHASVPLAWFLRDQSVDAQRQLCIRMSSRAAGGVETGAILFDRDDDWRELLDDMLRLNDNGQGIFGKLDPAEILEIFFSSLLRCGRFKLAKELLLGSKKLMDITKAEQLVIDAEREFFDNATVGNMNSGSLKQAWDCLLILPPTTEIKKEMDLVEATHALITDYKVQDRPGMTLMPIQIRQSKDRLELISKLIHTKRDMYRRHEQVLTLASKLGYGEDLLAKVKALTLMASAALVEEDYLESYKLCQIAVDAAQNAKTGKPKNYHDQVNQNAWQICLNLGKIEAFDDVNRRLDVLSMAMTLSPPENIRDVLAVWRKLDQDKPDQISLAQLSADNSNSKHDEAKGWQGLLQNATKQWSLGDLLTSGEHEPNGSKRKRDILRNAVGGWLFQ
ncbi:secretory pathway protein Sec39-domain-containing protein [Gilbertella persicaria]|uniref:secretory pathway protein Sec39-domain-containing protein n=1 Tax=Gilbertella persicaria TaxID=101096 RepID=UPI00221FE0A0|nr:secretory pathway protein Sec39-domain-containing protein [Gilbertella persicaria]KAI8056547.1 secretory pathway protein Sec39-domain-containing protein [Gilbertella persicaria]